MLIGRMHKKTCLELEFRISRWRKHFHVAISPMQIVENVFFRASQFLERRILPFIVWESGNKKEVDMHPASSCLRAEMWIRNKGINRFFANFHHIRVLDIKEFVSIYHSIFPKKEFFSLWTGGKEEKSKRENDSCIRQRSSGPYLMIIYQFYYNLLLRVLITNIPSTIP